LLSKQTITGHFSTLIQCLHVIWNISYFSSRFQPKGFQNAYISVYMHQPHDDKSLLTMTNYCLQTCRLLTNIKHLKRL